MIGRKDKEQIKQMLKEVRERELETEYRITKRDDITITVSIMTFVLNVAVLLITGLYLNYVRK